MQLAFIGQELGFSALVNLLCGGYLGLYSTVLAANGFLNLTGRTGSLFRGFGQSGVGQSRN